MRRRARSEKTALGGGVPTIFVWDCRLKNFNLNLILTCNTYVPFLVWGVDHVRVAIQPIFMSFVAVSSTFS